MEHEWADVDRRCLLPTHLGTWSDQDYTIVNSSGHANCPTGRTWRWGGEINTLPTESAAGQAEIVRQLVEFLDPKPVVNHRSNLHVHVKPDVDLLSDVHTLKQVARYLRRSESFVYNVLEPIPRPTESEYPSTSDMCWAVKRYKRRLVSHHYSLPLSRWMELLSATTVDGVKEAHAAPTRNGKRAWHIAPRPGMNLRSLWKHGTIEYRHFPGTLDPVEIESCAEWCLRFTQAAIDDGPEADELWRQREWRMPRFVACDPALERGYHETKFK
jgi:hypothetical protein